MLIRLDILLSNQPYRQSLGFKGSLDPEYQRGASAGNWGKEGLLLHKFRVSSMIIIRLAYKNI